MLFKSKRKIGGDMSWWFESAFFSLVTLCILLILSQEHVAAQTYCEDKPKILYYRRGQAALVGGGDTNQNGNYVVISNVNKEFLACVSSRNVEWTYEGEGEPSKFQESSTVDIQKYEDGSMSYCLTSQITFSNKQSDTELSRHTGSYSCREIGNVSNFVSVYVFASRKNSPTFLQSRKTITLPLRNENITLYQISGTSPSSSSSSNSSSVATPVFTIPCVTTHPNVTVKLLKKDRNNKLTVYDRGIQFDPKLGFLVNATMKSPDDLSEFYGDYKCVSSSSKESSNRKVNTEDFVFITIVKPKSFQIYPPTFDVYTSGMLNLTCESEEPVIMKEVLPPSAQDIYSYLDDDYGRDRSDDIIETTERTDEKTHIANYFEIAPSSGRSGEIQCLTEKDGKVLHTWRYRILRKRAEKLSGIKFNKREKSFTCKSKLGSPGRLSFVSCRTPSECRINRICLTKSENCRGYSNSTRAFCERKSHFCGKIFYKGGSGLIRCIGEGIDEIRGFTDEASVDHAVRMGFGKLKASETALLQLSGMTAKHSAEGQTGLGKLKKQQVANSSTLCEGDRVNVTLQMGYYYFLYPVQWAIKFKNGSTVQISPDSQYLQVDKLTRTVLASITLPYTSATTFVKYRKTNESNSNSTGFESAVDISRPSEIIALHALIPLRASVEPSWKTISLPLTVYGKKDVLLPSTDLESEELLIEQPLYLQPNENSSLSATNGTESGVLDGENDEDVEDEADEGQEEPAITIPTAALIINTTSEVGKGNDVTADAETLKHDGESKISTLNTTNTTNANSFSIYENNKSENGTVHIEINANASDSLNSNTKDASAKSTPVSLGIQSSTLNTSDPISDATSRDAVEKEANDDGEWMIVEKNQADETLFLARSGLLFDDKGLSNNSGESSDSKNYDESTKMDDSSIMTTTESLSLVYVAKNKEEPENDVYATSTDIETTTSPTLSDATLPSDESH